MITRCLFRCPCGRVRTIKHKWVYPRLSQKRLREMCEEQGFGFKVVAIACPNCSPQRPQ